MPVRRAIVTGRVQGVGFRNFVVVLARSLELRGEVWNRLDGAVEAYCAHDDEAVLDRFEERLREGPGQVDSVTIHPLAGDLADVDFRVGATRP